MIEIGQRWLRVGFDISAVAKILSILEDQYDTGLAYCKIIQTTSNGLISWDPYRINNKQNFACFPKKSNSNNYWKLLPNQEKLNETE